MEEGNGLRKGNQRKGTQSKSKEWYDKVSEGRKSKRKRILKGKGKIKEGKGRERKKSHCQRF